jgi:hypothetical protein
MRRSTTASHEERESRESVDRERTGRRLGMMDLKADRNAFGVSVQLAKSGWKAEGNEDRVNEDPEQMPLIPESMDLAKVIAYLGTAMARISRKPSPPSRSGAKAMTEPMGGKDGEDPRCWMK